MHTALKQTRPTTTSKLGPRTSNQLSTSYHRLSFIDSLLSKTRDPLPAISALALPLLILTLIFTPGCKVAQGVADLPGHTVRALSPRQKELQKIDFASLQSALMRFADECTANLILASEHLRLDGEPLPEQERLKMKLMYASEIFAIATKPNSLASLLDMVSVVTATRLELETYWVPEVYGASGEPLLEAARDLEVSIWSIAGRVLLPEEVQELRLAIENWHGEHQTPGTSLYLRTGNLFSNLQAQASPRAPEERGGLLGIVNLDPLSGLDPATRELAETRLFAERATFLMQRMPWLIRWQVELLAYQTAEIPEVQGLLTNVAGLTESADRLSRTAEVLPGQIQEERRILMDALDTQGTKLAALASQVEQTLLTGSSMVSNVNTTLTTFDNIVERLDSGGPKPDAPPSEPFRIQDYTETVRQVDAAAQRLTQLLQTFDQTLASTNLARVPHQADVLLKQAKTDGQTLVDYAFGRLLLLAALVCFLIVATTLLLRVLRPRST